MSKRIRLSEASVQVTAALATLDGAALRELKERLNMVAAQAETERSGIEPEPVQTVERELQILGKVLTATQGNIHLLQRLRERKARQEWAL